MMTRRALTILLLLLLISSSVYGQMDISGILRDSADQSPVSYATVSIAGTTTGTTSDQSGHFALTVPADQSHGTLSVSCLGYETRQIGMADVRLSGNVFILRRKAFKFREVTVSPGYKREITAKMIEKMMSKISDTLYVSKTETTIFLYKVFLEDICKDNNALCDTASFHYNEGYTSHQMGYSSQVFYLNEATEFAEKWPVSDVTYEGARLFCAWLTHKYAEFSKRKYKNATFRLPSSAEWTYAAQGGSKVKTPYAWPGDKPYYIPPRDTQRLYYVNYIGSYDTLRDGHLGFYGCSAAQGGYPNSFGLYHMCGNVSEMVQERGVYRGGCAMDKLENIGIYAPQEPGRKEPDFFIGFRVAMVSVQ